MSQLCLAARSMYETCDKILKTSVILERLYNQSTSFDINDQQTVYPPTYKKWWRYYMEIKIHISQHACIDADQPTYSMSIDIQHLYRQDVYLLTVCSCFERFLFYNSNLSLNKVIFINVLLMVDCIIILVKVMYFYYVTPLFQSFNGCQLTNWHD